MNPLSWTSYHLGQLDNEADIAISSPVDAWWTRGQDMQHLCCSAPCIASASLSKPRALYSQCICVAFPLYVSSCGPPAYTGLWMVSAPGNSPAIGTQTLSSRHVYGHCLYAVWVEDRSQINRNVTSSSALLLIYIERGPEAQVWTEILRCQKSKIVSTPKRTQGLNYTSHWKSTKAHEFISTDVNRLGIRPQGHRLLNGSWIISCTAPLTWFTLSNGFLDEGSLKCHSTQTRITKSSL